MRVEAPRRSARSPVADEHLARRAAGGDDGAFDELRERYVRELSRYAARLIGDLTVGEEVAARALRDARRALRRGTRPACVSPWLYRITLNAALDLRADRPGEPVPASRRLPERQRQAFVLREVYGLSVHEIAIELGLTAREVQEAQFAARARLAALGAIVRSPRLEPPPPVRRRSTRPAVLAVAAAAVALCVGMPVAATYAPDRGAPAPVLAIPPAHRAL